ncbi:18341_t:CDS:1 [Funneliformis geosporum]|uniref:12504_t:CDS:1 n=1 Tax=Funneliformis geosporum TaxID=1117311 RepID=A0A9W4SHF9_9GLOM|nr:18341_t:CDS:1 [Funneliformis geosporum]CAI2168480.1 12504_t:CDS:1 [Funneliformis geosporum]
MDLSWCPVCDKHTFAVENLYCSEACRKKDKLSTLNEKCCYDFPRCSSRKPYQYPFYSPNHSPESSPSSSPMLHPTHNTTSYETSPTDLLLYENHNYSYYNSTHSLIMKIQKK